MLLSFKNKARSTGFTLVEVVIALAILAIAFFGMISVITYTSRMNAATRERMLAMRAAERKIEQMLACVNFDDMFLQFNNMTEGFGWEQVTELDNFNNTSTVAANQTTHTFKGLKSLGATTSAPTKLNIDAKQRTVETGYAYPAPPAAAVLWVRFPLDPAGPTNAAGLSSTLTEVNAGEFMGMGAGVSLDLNRSGTAGDATNLTIATCKILPVSIDVFWRGTVGPSSGGSGNTYLRYRYTFLRKT